MYRLEILRKGYALSKCYSLQYVMMSVYGEYLSVITQDGFSALMMAAMEGKTEVIVELVKARANVDMQNEVCCII